MIILLIGYNTSHDYQYIHILSKKLSYPLKKKHDKSKYKMIKEKLALYKTTLYYPNLMSTIIEAVTT